MPTGDCEIESASKSDLLFAAIAASPLAILLIDPNVPGGPIVRANPAFAALTGFAEGEALGRDIGILRQAGSAAAFARVGDAIGAGTALDLELECRRKDGTSFVAALFLSPVADADGRLSYLFCTLFDVDGRRAAARERGAALGLGEARELVRGFVHELNNLLTVMRSNLEPLLQSPADPRSPLRLERVAWAVDGAAERARALAARFRAEGQATEAASKLPRARAGECILLVEPDEVLGLQAGSMLRGLGYRVACVAEAQAALQHLSGPDGVDLLIADARLRCDGGALLAELARQLAREIKVLHSASSRGPGRPGVLAKPFQLVELARAVRAAIDAAPR